jgi:hypothetical protein
MATVDDARLADRRGGQGGTLLGEHSVGAAAARLGRIDTAASCSRTADDADATQSDAAEATSAGIGH